MLCEGVMSYAEASGDLTLGHALLMNHPTQVGVSTGHRDAKVGVAVRLGQAQLSRKMSCNSPARGNAPPVVSGCTLIER
jgi:hypothetical protein